MAKDETKVSGPDLTAGIAVAELADGGKLVGHVGGEEVLLVRRGTEIFAVAAQCTHYHGPLVEGIVVDDTVRCPWHHACFDLRTGEALRAPALSPLACWSVEQRDGKIFVRDKLAKPKPQLRAAGRARTTRKDRHHRRRRGRFCGRRAIAARGLRGQHRDAQRRRSTAGRSAESLEGLSCGHGARGMGAAAPRAFLFQERHRPAAQREGGRHRCTVARGHSRRRQGALRSAPARNRRRADSLADSGRRQVARPNAAVARG